MLYNNASQSALNSYKVIMLAGDVVIDDTLRAELTSYVNGGGTLIANVNQATAADQSLLGVTLSSSTATGTSSRWLADGSTYSELQYTYNKVTLTTATKVADNNGSGDALITVNNVGLGKVYLTTPGFMQSNDKTQILNIGQKLTDSVMTANVSATVEGAATYYIVNTAANKIVVTVMNNSGTAWSGTVDVNKPAGAYTTQEWVTDTPVTSSVAGNQVKINATVPAYDVRVFAITW